MLIVHDFEVAEVTQNLLSLLNTDFFNNHVSNHIKQLKIKFMESLCFRHLFDMKFLIKELGTLALQQINLWNHSTMLAVLLVHVFILSYKYANYRWKIPWIC